MSPSTHIPIPALNRYALYKTGTATLIDWLLSISASCGYGDPQNPPKNPVPVSRLLRCAKTISAKRPAVHIPGNIIELAVDVIQGRELYEELYASVREDDQSHRHFINVLRDVAAVLRDARKRYKEENLKPVGKRNFSGESGTSTDTAVSCGEDVAANMFSHLTFESPSAKPFSTPEKQSTNKRYATPSMLATTPEEECKMALVCYLEDMKELRQYVRDLWKGYAAGDLSLDVVCTTTELAFGCMRRAEEDLGRLHSSLGGYDGTYEYQGLVCALMESMFVDNKDDTSNQHRADLLCCIAYFAASSIASECEQLAKRPQKRQKNKSSSNPTEVFVLHPFTAKVMSIVPDLVRVSDPVDEFASEFCPQNDKGEYPIRIFTVMMIQSYTEIWDIIGDPALLITQALEAVFIRNKQSVDKCLQTRSRVRNPLHFEDLDRYEQKLSESEEFLSALRTSDTASPSRLNSEARIFKVLPVGAFERIKYLKWGMNLTSARVANDGWIIISMAYIYRAAQHYGMMSETWEDLEWLIALQSKTRPYVIEVAKHADEEAFCRHYRLAFGMGTGSVDAKKINKCTQNMRRIEPMLDYPARMELESQSQDRLGYERGEMAEVVLRKMTADRFAGKKSKNSKKEVERRFSAMKLLETYKETFVNDEPEYNMDLLGLWSELAQLMKSIHEFCYPKLMREELDPAYVLDAQVVKPMLEEAAYYRRHGMDMNKTQIAVAARMVEKYLKSKGGFFLKETMGMSSGHILEENRPKLTSQK